MTPNKFLTKYEKVIQDFYDKGGWDTQKVGDYIDIFYECKSDFYGTFIDKWTKSDEARLVRVVDDCQLQPIAGIGILIRWTKDRI